MQAPPVWDLSSFFPSFDGPEYRAFLVRLNADVAALLADAQQLPTLDAASAPTWSALVAKWEEAMARAGHVGSYVHCLASTDGADERYQIAEGNLATVRAAFEKVGNELRRGLGQANDADFAALTARPELAGTGFQLEQMRVEAKFRMPGPLEALASDLGPDGLNGWGRLYDVVSGKLSFAMTFPDGHTETVPMAQRRSLMADPDRRVRQAAFSAGNVAWEGAADVVASSLNHIAGTRHVLNARRGVAHVHDVALHDAAISRKTLDAMMEAVKDGADVARKGLRLKGKAMGLEGVAWFDLEAPLPLASTRRIPWGEGIALVRDAFGEVTRAFAPSSTRRSAIASVEAEPRTGKRPGATAAAVTSPASRGSS